MNLKMIILMDNKFLKRFKVKASATLWGGFVLCATPQTLKTNTIQ